jgi:ribose/xylose/arabinose/galactoside ABC-type transport system permease subunit
MVQSPLARAIRPWLILILVCAGFSVRPEFRNTFWTAGFLPNVLQQAAANVILAVGMTYVILTGGIDLSVGSLLALCGVTLGLTVTAGPTPLLAYIMVFPAAALTVWMTGRSSSRLPEIPALRVAVAVFAGLAVLFLGQALVMRSASGGIQLEGAILAAVAVGLSGGLLNGLLVTKGRVPPFIVTLGMLTAARGLTVYATGGLSVGNLPPRLSTLGGSGPMVMAALAVVLIGGFLLRRTRAGRYVTAIGGNEEAARLTGVDVAAYKTLAYIISGITAAIAGILLTAEFGLADTNAGAKAELNAIAAVVIGGTSLSGGQGSIVGSLVGALTIAVLNVGLVLTGVPDTLQGVVVGAVIVLAVMVDRWRAPR